MQELKIHGITPEIIKTIELKYNIKILYITKVGSQLYGTTTSKSDTDYKAIYKVNKDNLLVDNAIHCIVLSTGAKGQKNSKEDVDFTLDSLHKWLKSVASGETGALDILFSIFREDTIVYSDPDFISLIKKEYKLLLSKNPKAFIGYCIGQSSKYAIKGSRYKELTDFIRNFYVFSDKIEDEKMSIRWDDFKKLVTNSGYKYIKIVTAAGPRKTDDIEYLEVLGRKYAPTGTYSHVLTMLNTLQDSYGDRAKNCGTDVEWKSLSNAVRVIDEVIELLTHNFITFPLTNNEYIKNIKNGTVDLDDVINYIADKIIEADEATELSELPSDVSKEVVSKLILSFYN